MSAAFTRVFGEPTEGLIDVQESCFQESGVARILRCISRVQQNSMSRSLSWDVDVLISSQ